MEQGDKFRIARERVGLSQGQVAEYAETAQGYISGIENNKRWPSTWTLLQKLALRYRVSADFLLGIGRNVSLEGQAASELIDALPPEKRAAAVALLQAIIEFAEIGVPFAEPVEARDRGGVTNDETDRALKQTLNAKKDSMLALLEKMVPPAIYDEVRALVESGRPLTEADIDRFLEASSQQPSQQRLQSFQDDTAALDG
jgi:transcriptional regulator with XRE-family HTH domain